MMKNKLAVSGLVALGLAVMAGCQQETERQATIRMMKEAEACARKQCQNDLVGFTRIISSRVDLFKYAPTNCYSTEPKHWQAHIVAEHVNHNGGIDRTNLYYQFGIYRETAPHSRRELLCYEDGIERSNRMHLEYEAFLKRLAGGNRSD
jgi:hypothetical protein